MRLPLSCRYLSTAATKALRPRTDFQPVIGLEVHVQLATKTKLFSRAANSESSPNSCVAPFDLSTPGTLPRLNEQCVQHTLRLASLLQCEIPASSRFVRKHYFYADMPAGYQITQNEHPVAKAGMFPFYVFGEGVEAYDKRVRIIQLQLEQDSGKTIHVDGTSLIDFNRAGCALVEVVTNCDLRSALEASCLVQQLRLIMMHHGICHGEMHKGHIRVDANVSLSEGGRAGTRTEVKNINSFRHLHTAINYEIDRQYRILAEGGTILNETRACDAQGCTVSMRDKEVDTDYRFMVEPNLPIVKVSDAWVKDAAAAVTGSVPRHLRYMSELRLDPRSAIHYAEETELSRFVDACASNGWTKDPNEFITWLKELKQMMQRGKAVFPPESLAFAKQFVTIVDMYAAGQVTRLRAIDLLRKCVAGEEKDVIEIVGANNWWRVTDAVEIARHVEKIAMADPKFAEKVKSGNAKATNKLRGRLIEAMEKRVDVDAADEAIWLWVK